MDVIQMITATSSKPDPSATDTTRRHEETADNFDGLIPHFVTEAGFGEVKEAQHFVTIFGPLSMLRAVKGA